MTTPDQPLAANQRTENGPAACAAAQYQTRDGCVAFRTRQAALMWLRVVDLVVAAISLLLSAAVATSDVGNRSLSLDVSTIVLFIGLFVATTSVFSLFALYTETALFQWREALKSTIKASTAVLVILVAAAALLNPPLVTPVFLVTYWLLVCVGSVGVRFGARLLLFLTEAQGVAARRTVIVGTNARAQAIARRMLDHPGHGYRFQGFIWDGWEVSPSGPPARPFELISDLAGFSDYLRDTVVDEVVICLPLAALCATVAGLVAQCEEQGVAVTVVTRLFELKNPRQRPGSHGGELVVTVSNTLADERELILKRFLDVSVAAVSLLVLSPLLAVIWLLVRLTSPGPAFFVQERVGLNKRLFKFYKFRTMVQNAEALQPDLEAQNETNGATFKIKNDPRITPLGRILRKTSIDELPQLVNVLRGEMSLVGPRPLPVRDVVRIEKDWPRRRFGVKPGITCLWQICGRNTIPFERMMELDIEYVDTWSILLDLKILVRTVPVVCSMRGAY